MADFKFISSKEIVSIFERFKSFNPEPKTELISVNDYTLLVAVVLSAQATDKSVNKATESLFRVVTTPEQMVALGEEKLIPYIKSIGLYRAKAKNVIKLSHQLIENFDSKVPSTREELMTLAGVGRKTANVMLNVVFHQKVMPVDTHILRLSNRMGFCDCTTAESVEKSLVSKIPEQYMEHAHHWLILHGRYVCTARNPDCDHCIIADLCPKNMV